MAIQKEQDKKRYEELLSQGMRPSEALQTIAIESRGQTKENEGSRYQYSNPVKSDYTFIGEVKHLGREVGREVSEFPKRKLKEAAEDIETGRTYRESYRKNKIEAASSRGVEAELRHHKEKVIKETDIIDREKARKDIAISAEKAYYTAKARSAGRQAGIIATQQQFAIQQQQQRPRKQWAAPVYMKNPYRQPTAQELDPLGIYTLRPYNSTQQINNQQAQKIDMSYMNSLLGFNPPSQQSQSKAHKSQSNKQKRRKFNIFTAQWEWV